CTAGLAFGAVLVYGLKRDWPWITDPPEWMFAIYLPAVIKMLWGPKHVRRFAYLTAYGYVVMSIICISGSLLDLREANRKTICSRDHIIFPVSGSISHSLIIHPPSCAPL